MIQELSVENLAIIERAQIALGPGLTVLTGETGAGKSLLMDAVELAFGSRADSDLVRSGSRRAAVTVAIDISNEPALRQLCDELGVRSEDGTLFIQREVYAEGRSQCRIGGNMAPLAVLKRLGRALVDLHGQHDHQSLLHPESHIGFLDAWIGDPSSDLLIQVSLAHSEAQDLRRRLDTLRIGQRDREHRLDMLRFQVGEIGSFGPRVGEALELEGQLSRLRNAEKLAEAAHGALSAIRDAETNAQDLLSVALRQLESAAQLDASLEPALESLRAGLYSLEDCASGLRSYVENLESDPERLEQTAERLDGLRRLLRKYGDDEAAILAFLETAQSQLDLLEGSENSEEELGQALEQADQKLSGLAEKLSALRKAKAAEFATLVQAQLNDLAMEGARLQVSITEKPVDSSGMDAVELFFSANAGEPPRPLSKIASGGEISRVMLAIKSVMAGRAGVPTLVFDEVDAGLGGRAAAVVGKKLEELALHYQVIVISHLPQIASRAINHFRISKVEQSGRVATEVHLLRGQERVEEIARMLAGEEVGTSALVHAKEMLAEKQRAL